MSWDVSLEKDGKPVTVSPHVEGRTLSLDPKTFAVAPSDVAVLNVTYNYATKLRIAYAKTMGRVLGNTNALGQILDGKTGLETGLSLLAMASYLQGCADTAGPEEGDGDYLKPTNLNVLRTVRTLGLWAVNSPEAVWRVS